MTLKVKLFFEIEAIRTKAVDEWHNTNHDMNACNYHGSPWNYKRLNKITFSGK